MRLGKEDGLTYRGVLYDVNGLLVRNDIPEPIRRHDHHFILSSQDVLTCVWRGHLHAKEAIELPLKSALKKPITDLCGN